MPRHTSKPKPDMHQQIETAQQAIDSALADITVLAFLADYGCTMARLREGQQLCLAAQRAADEADISMDALKTWLDEFLTLAQAALQPRPDLMKQLRVKSSK